MRRLLITLAAASAAASVLCVPAAGAAEAVHGVWVREGHPMDKLEFFDCAGKLCAKGILPMLDGSPAPLVLRNAVKDTANHWKGDLFNPENGKMYKGEITLDSANQLTLTGCLVAFLCQSETWNRVPKSALPAAEGAKTGAAHPKAETAPAAAPATPEEPAAHPKADAPAAKAAPAKPAAAKPAPAKPAPAKPAPTKPAPAKPKPADDEAQ